ncbi:serine hydrolase [Nocardioides albidus]|uniref:Serine hydrolase n=1 Tax=Nocardioides albidus TaxID=1517589 RepID=A0A5C4WRE7_9ACTN|nr:serine hydrolase [Nocardioides albidus]TNM50791.1 serine hydrolase [Nocardioides albidus]
MSSTPASPAHPGNWQDPEHVAWSFQHIPDLFPVATIGRGTGPVAPLAREDRDLGGLSVPSDDTDAWLVLHRGAVVAEEYAGTMTPDTRHLLMSVSKSVVGLVAGILAGSGRLDERALVTSYLPDLAGSGWDGATVRDLLDMRVGIHFSEDYLEPTSQVRRLDEAVGWAERGPRSPANLRAFLAELRGDRPHAGPFAYSSAITDALGLVCEAAGGAPFPDLASDLLWSRIGAEHDAIVSVDPVGTSMFDGGVCATARDLARFGALVARGGRSLTGERVVAEEWIDDLFRGGGDSAAAFAAADHDHGLPGGSYRGQFWSPAAGGDVVLCLGIHGQMVYVDRARDFVGVKLGSWPVPVDEERGPADLAAFGALAERLAGS